MKMCSIPPARIEPCPFLPDIGGSRFRASALAAFRDGLRGGEFYLLGLRCAQSRWLEGLPAQALLMLNRTMGASLEAAADADLLRHHPVPFRAVAWILRHGERHGFIGNPRRHFQHLATRMGGGEGRPRRIARAWACWELARTVNGSWPADLVQIGREKVVEPDRAAIEASLSRHGWPGEVDEWRRALEDSLGENVHDRNPLVRDLEGSR